MKKNAIFYSCLFVLGHLIGIPALGQVSPQTVLESSLKVEGKVNSSSYYLAQNAGELPGEPGMTGEASIDGGGTPASPPHDSNANPSQGAAVPAAGGDNDGMGMQLPSHVDIEAAYGKVFDILTNSPPGVRWNAPNYTNISNSFSKYMKEKPVCVSRHSKAASACLEHLSVHLTTGVTVLNSLISMKAMTSVNESCDKASKAMKAAKAAMTAYTGLCGLMKAGCGTSCLSVTNALGQLQASIKADIAAAPTSCTEIIPPNGVPQCPELISSYVSALTSMQQAVSAELNKGEKISMAGKTQVCEQKYAQLITSGVLGIASMLQTAKQSSNCDKQTNGTGKETEIAAVDKCIDPKNASLPECICRANPRTPGCSNGYAKPGETSSNSLVAGNNPTGIGSSIGKGSGPSTLSGGSGAEDASTAFAGGSNSGDSSGSYAGGSGGGGGLSGGGMGGSGGGDSEASEDKKGLSANILGSAGGGGGGSGSGGGGGWNSVRGSGAASSYRAYLPGGAKDPARGLAGQQSWAREVTGQGGKSNWEKVRERYRDNKNSLLNN